MTETIQFKVASRIKSWDGWPEDVVAALRDANKRKVLSFVYTLPNSIFKCEACLVWHMVPGTVAVLNGEALCDDCLIIIARSGGVLRITESVVGAVSGAGEA